MTATMLEKATRAACVNLMKSDKHEGYVGDYGNHEGLVSETIVLDGEFDIRDVVRAVLVAIRDPDEAMVTDGGLSADRDGWGGPTLCWQIMIDSILGQVT